MFETVAKGFRAAKHKLAGKVELNEGNIDDALRDIRVSLLEADVDYNAVKQFIATVKEKALGEVVKTVAVGKKGERIKVTAGDHFVKICHDELEAMMGPPDTSLRLGDGKKPAGVMMVGLQGSGKTTTAAKLARWLREEKKKKPLLVAADIYRPAAIDQLKVLGARLEIPVFHIEHVKPPELCKQALEEARRKGKDVVIFDTAGRLAVDEEMMQELEAVKAAVQPENILLVCDAMIGQDAVRTAAEFDRRLSLDGFVLTKLDGDARGGAALSLKMVTHKPIKFVGVGEGLDKLEEFRPEGVASRILGFGDIVGLMQDFSRVADEEQAEKDAEKILTGQFDMEDFVNQIKLVRKMGSITSLLEKFPIFGELPEGITFDDKELVKVEAIVGSMTRAERKNPELLENKNRVARVARGSGRKPAEVEGLLNRFFAMRKVMKQIGSAEGLMARLPGFQQLAQLRQMKGLDMSELFGDLAPAMAGGAPPPTAGGRRMNAAETRARLMGYAPPPRVMTDEEKRRLKDKRKRERDARKKARRNRR